MITRKFAVYSLILVVLTAISACNKDTAKPQAVVLNFQTASEAVNLAERVKEFSNSQNQAMNDELAALSKEFRGIIDDKKSEFGDSLSKEQQEALKTVKSKLQQQFNQRRTTLNTKLRKENQAYRQSVIDEFIPITRQVAKEHGASIVLKNNPVLWSEQTLDITDEVVSRLAAMQETPSQEAAETVEPDTTE